MKFKREKLSDGFVKIELNSNKNIVQQGAGFELLAKSVRNQIWHLLERAKKIGDKVQEENIMVVPVGSHSEILGEMRFYYKVSFRGQDYFVKEMSRQSAEDFGGGASQIEDMLKAKALITDFENVVIPEYQFGFEDLYHTYLVAKWDPALTKNLNQWFQTQSEQGINYKQTPIYVLYQKIKNRLNRYFFDVDSSNMAFDEKNNKLVVFDLIKKPERNVD